MKKTFIALLALASLSMTAKAEVLTFGLPDSKVFTTGDAQTKNTFNNTEQILNTFKSQSLGVYAGTGANGGIGGITTYTEGGELCYTYNSATKTGSVTLAKRTIAGGCGFALVLDNTQVTAGSLVSSVTFHIGSAANTVLSGDLNVVLGLYDGSSYIKSATDTITIGSSADSTTLTLTFDNAVTWTDNMKIVAGVTVGKALAGVNNTDKYTLNGMSLSADVKAVPEPATATLSLLALAGLVARRRRH